MLLPEAPPKFQLQGARSSAPSGDISCDNSEGVGVKAVQTRTPQIDRGEAIRAGMLPRAAFGIPHPNMGSGEILRARTARLRLECCEPFKVLDRDPAVAGVHQLLLAKLSKHLLDAYDGRTRELGQLLMC